jgi:hypothetical protein
MPVSQTYATGYEAILVKNSGIINHYQALWSGKPTPT